MEEASIWSAIEKLEADTQRTRSKGLEDLRRILGDARVSGKLDILSDDGFHTILELLYKLVRVEKPSYLRAAKSTSQNIAAVRLTAAAAALRLVVESGNSKLGSKTAISVLDHITETLPTANDGFCAPLQNDYLKSFRILLDYSPHAEHLRPKQWQLFVDFILHGLELSFADDDQEDDSPSSAALNGTFRDKPVSFRASQRSVRKTSIDSVSSDDELVYALRSLSGIPNAPLLTRSTAIIKTLSRFLDHTGKAQEAAFEVLNDIISLVITENTSQIQSLLSSLLPTIRRLWDNRSSALREQLLITLYLCRYFFLTIDEPFSIPISTQPDQLFYTLFSSYCNRNERDLLAMEDITFIVEEVKAPCRLLFIAPVQDSARSMTAWTTLSTMACLYLGLSRNSRPLDQARNTEGVLVKRRKLETNVEDLIETSISGTETKRLASLQVLLFLFDQRVSVPDILLDRIPELSALLIDNDSQTTSWAYLVLTRYAKLSGKKVVLRQNLWDLAWNSARRSISASTTTRAACHLLDILSTTKFRDTSMTTSSLNEFFFGGGSNGPFSVTETALQLFTNLLQSNILSHDDKFEEFALNIIKWLSSHWNISPSFDRSQNSQIASLVQSDSLFQLISSVRGLVFNARPLNAPLPAHVIYQAVLKNKDRQQFTEFLFGIEPREDPMKEKLFLGHGRRLKPISRARLDQAVREMLTQKLKDFTSEWTMLQSERNTNISAAVVQIASTAVSVACVAFDQSSDSTEPHHPLIALCNSLFDNICNYIADQSNDARATLISQVSGRLLALRSQTKHEDQTFSQGRVHLTQSLIGLLQMTLDSQDKYDTMDFEFMDSAETRLSQNSQMTMSQYRTFAPRQELPISRDTMDLIAWYSFELLIDRHQGSTSQRMHVEENALILKQILDMPSNHLLAARQAILYFLHSRSNLTRDDASHILERLATAFLQDEDFERCDTALGFCLSVLKVLAHLWMADDEDALNEVAFDVYEWYLSTALGKAVASPRLLLAIANLLDTMMELNVSFAMDPLPSPRTSLFKILGTGNSLVKYSLASKLTRIFQRYILSEHEVIFDDIVSNLPADPENREGISARLYLVCQLGAKWHTILRQASYHLFETAAHVPSCSKMADRCIREMCLSLHLDTPRKLFQIFGSQIIYTWLGKNNIAQIPFRVFQYTSLNSLVFQNLDEFVAQVALRGSTKHAEELSEILNLSWKETLSRSFHLAESYCLASDTSLPEAEKLFNGAEMLIRRQLGTDNYLGSLRDSFPDIIANLFIKLQDDRGIERAFDKSGNSVALTALKDILNHSASKAILPLEQQPSFRARYLLVELDYLYSRLHVNMDDVWSSALLVHVYRSLLAKITPAQGPLHTCSIVRKIRIVVCIAGSVAVQGYPLAMLLHCLRPYITDLHTSEDAIGVFWYLVDRGKPHLQSEPSFTTGLLVSAFASLTDFVGSSQDGTTSESQFVSVLTNAQNFRQWIGMYLNELNFTNLAPEKAAAFKLIAQSVIAASASISSEETTATGQLVHDIIADAASSQPLLRGLDFGLSLQILSKGFSNASQISNQIVVEHQDAMRFAPVLQSVTARLDLHVVFRNWAAEIIGKGQQHATMRSNVGRRDLYNHKQGLLLGTSLTAISSYSNIVEVLLNSLWEPSFETSTFAEKTLQVIANSLSNTDLHEILDPALDKTILEELRYSSSVCPRIRSVLGDHQPTATWKFLSIDRSTQSWSTNIINAICTQLNHDPILKSIKPLVSAVPDIAVAIFPYVVHLALIIEHEESSFIQDMLSQIFSQVLVEEDHQLRETCQLVLRTIVYFRRCRYPIEQTMADRNAWLKLNFEHCAAAAARNSMWNEALLFAEIHWSQSSLQASRSSRRSITSASQLDSGLLSTMFQHLGDPDSFYGNVQDYDMPSVIQKLEHEGSYLKTVSFQSAMFDTFLKFGTDEVGSSKVKRSTVAALGAANLHGISRAVNQFTDETQPSNNHNFTSQQSFSLHQWDLQSDMEVKHPLDYVSDVFQAMESTATRETILFTVQESLTKTLGALSVESKKNHLQHEVLLLNNLTVLAEIKEIVLQPDFVALENTLRDLIAKTDRADFEAFNDVSSLILARETIFGTIARNESIQSIYALTPAQAMLLEVKAVRNSLKIAQHYEIPQLCLNKAAYLAKLSENASEIGIKLSSAIQLDLARTFWSQDEIGPSIAILKNILLHDDLSGQSLPLSRSVILTDLGQKIADARMEKPDEIVSRYLQPAIKELRGQSTGSEAGRAFHNFATFCDMQLQDSDNLDDFTRMAKIRDRKLQEVRDLEKMIKNGEGKHVDQLKIHLSKAKTWFRLDDEEWQRLQSNRQTLILQCLENYLLSMKACDDYKNDTLRFLALWLDQAESRKANATVQKSLGSVPTLKFAPLMNQLSSRILDNKDEFQQILLDLVFRICCDHPYHSLYQIFATSKSKGAKNDEVAASRHNAATKIAELVRRKGNSSAIWIAVHNSSIAFVKVAQEKLPDKDIKTGSKIPLNKLVAGQKLESVVQDSHIKIPPPTMKIQLRIDKDYSSVPTFDSFEPLISIAGGVSAPKIATVVASDGSRNKMLLKGGNDDLRQDSIMEQVFELVSDLLKDHRATRKRKLGIRTYKVIPLYLNAGIIEFVKDTIPLHDYSLPAHTRYFPKDYKPNRCRKEIADAQTKPLQQRIQAYRNVTANFHPVMRFFFMEHFLNPDEWYTNRLNYSRSTATMSILGHVLGLGDRHGHNILLDENSGEVVHIDLGVAFEAGRVLPVPEVVPFRLTRDLVDGMGLSGVEGVFRRCCNFTLEALRQDQESIMTILDVLRYDPLYSWSVSPLRLQKMQENNEQAAAAAAAAATSAENETEGTINGKNIVEINNNNNNPGIGLRKDIGEPNEADRALTVVTKKLGKSLSVEATVNELIRQATDERNLAVLYCGWAAYA